jgi:prepilin-type N-terminal cleavage/methylation domain-containing protein
MKKAFTMIELIFVIVILGILAAVAIPKMMATRTDAKIAAISQEAAGIVSEVPNYVTSQGRIDDFYTMSQVAKTLVDQKQAYENQGKRGNEALDANYTKMTGSTDYLILGTPNDEGTLEPCLAFDINTTTLKVSDTNNTDVGAICKGVRARIKEATYTIAGQGVKF